MVDRALANCLDNCLTIAYAFEYTIGSKPMTKEPGIFPLTQAMEPEAKPEAWAMIELGRFQPRRIRGSLLGRDLG